MHDSPQRHWQTDLQVDEGESDLDRRAQAHPGSRWVIALSLLVLGLGLANLGRLGMALHYATGLSDLPLTVPLSYLAAMGGFWGLAFILCAIGLLRFRRRGRWPTLTAVTLYQAHIWVNHLLFDASDYAQGAYPRDLVLTLALLTLFWGSLGLPKRTSQQPRDGFGQQPGDGRHGEGDGVADEGRLGSD